MSVLAYLALYGWIVCLLILFARLRPRHAVLVALIVPWLFLPVVEQGGLRWTKMIATCGGSLAAALLFDGARFRSFRPRWFDLPVLSFCLAQFIPALLNEPPPDGSSRLWDAFSLTVVQTITWGGPYLLGRVYFGEPQSFRELLLALVLGGLVYVPLCLFEVRMSPQLHNLFYGYQAHPDFSQTMRFGGYRPMVFLQHGLAVGTWMMTTTLIAFWLWKTGAVTRLDGGPRLGSVSLGLVVGVLVVTTLLCKSMGAILLGLTGAAVLLVTRWKEVPAAAVALAALLAVPPLYVAGRSSGAWTGEELVTLFSTNVNEERAQSLEFRLENEALLRDKALQKPFFGWGSWGRSRVTDEEGKDISVTDGLWIIVLGETGFVGLVSLLLVYLLPPGRFLWAHPPRLWATPAFAGGAVAAMALILYMIDDLSNAMLNPLFLTLAGGLAGVTGSSAAPPAPRRSGTVPRPVVARPTGPESPRPGVLVRRRYGIAPPEKAD